MLNFMSMVYKVPKRVISEMAVMSETYTFKTCSLWSSPFLWVEQITVNCLQNFIIPVSLGSSLIIFFYFSVSCLKMTISTEINKGN